MTWKRIATGIVAVAALVATAGVVSASDSTVASADAHVGPSRAPRPPVQRPFLSVGTGEAANVLVTAKGQAVYYNDQDTLTLFVCAGICTKVWRPLIAPPSGQMSTGPGVEMPLSTVHRPDGTVQAVYNNHPLYTYSVDAIGHVTGDRVLDSYDGQAYSWHAATADGQPRPSAAPSPSGLPSGPGLPGLPTPGTPLPTAPSLPPLTPTPSPTPTRAGGPIGQAP